MEILENFGFEPVLFVAQIVNFIIVLFVLQRFLYKPILKTLKQRKDIIEEGLQKAEEARKLFEKAQKEEKEILKNANMEARKLLTEARNEAMLMHKKAEENAKQKTEIMMNETREQLQREAKEVQAQITHNVSTLAVDFLRKALSELFSQQGQAELMEKAIKQIQKKPN